MSLPSLAEMISSRTLSWTSGCCERRWRIKDSALDVVSTAAIVKVLQKPVSSDHHTSYHCEMINTYAIWAMSSSSDRRSCSFADIFALTASVLSASTHDGVKWRTHEAHEILSLRDLALERLVPGLPNSLLVVIDRDRLLVHRHYEAAKLLKGFVREPCGANVPHQPGHDSVNDG